MQTLICAAVLMTATTAHAQALERLPPPCTPELQQHAKEGAKHGDPASVYLLARYLSTGQCMPGDGRRAIQLYGQAAELGYPPAFYNLGMLAGGRQDFPAAESYFERGAKLGHRGCEVQLGVLYSLVSALVGDDVKAYAWLSLTASRAEPIAAEARDRLALVRSRLSAEQRARAEALVEDLQGTYAAIPPFKP